MEEMMKQNPMAQEDLEYEEGVEEAAEHGRDSDTEMAHVTRGDVIIPRDIVMENPEFLVRLKKIMKDKGVDYRTHMVGSGMESRNPDTGAPEFAMFNGMSGMYGGDGPQSGGMGGMTGMGDRIMGAATQYSGMDQGFNMGQKLLGGANSSGGKWAGGLYDSFKQVGNPLNAFKSPSAFGKNLLNLGTMGLGGKLLGGGGPSAGQQALQMAAMKNFQDMQQRQKIGRSANKIIGQGAGAASGTDLQGLSPLQQRAYLATQETQGTGLSPEQRKYFGALEAKNVGKSGLKNRITPVEGTALRYSNVNPDRGNQTALMSAISGAYMR